MSRICPACGYVQQDEDADDRDLPRDCPTCGAELLTDDTEFDLDLLDPAEGIAGESGLDDSSAPAEGWLAELEPEMDHSGSNSNPELIDFDDSETVTIPQVGAGHQVAPVAAPTSQNATTPILEAASAAAAGQPGDEIPSAKLPFDMAKSTAPAVPPKRRGNPVLNGVKLAAGLLLGVGLLQLLSWWALGLDPAQVGYMLPKSLSWIAPAKFTVDGYAKLMKEPIIRKPSANGTDSAEDTEEDDPEEDAEDGAEDGSTADNTADTATSEDADSAGDMDADEGEDARADDDADEQIDMAAVARQSATDLNVESDMPATTERAPDEATDSPAADSIENEAGLTDDAGMEEAAPPSAPESEPSPSPDAGLVEAPAATPESSDFSDSSDASDSGDFGDFSAPAADPAIPSVALKAPPSFSLNDLNAANLQAAKAMDALLSAQSAPRGSVDIKQKAREAYTAMAELGKIANFVDTRDAEPPLKETQALLERIANQPAWLRMVATSSVAWLENNLGDGVITAGEITSVELMDGARRITVKPLGKSSSITCVNSIDGTEGTGESLAIGDRIMILGYVVRDPANALSGYVGTETEVVWSPRLVRVLPP